MSFQSLLERSGKLLGKGSYGAVYEYEGNAVKVLTQPDDMLARDVITELAIYRATAGLPNVARLDRIERDEEHLYLFTRLFSSDMSKKIKARKRGRSLPPTKIFLPLVRGLAGLHSRGVVHSDIKPGNILVSKSGDPAYTDYGLSFVTRCSDNPDSRRVRCTYVFAAPEDIANHIGGKKADVYSLGVTMACWLGGFSHPDQDALQLLAQVNNMSVEDVKLRFKEERHHKLCSVTLVDLLGSNGAPHRIGHIPAEMRDGIDAMLRVNPVLRPNAADITFAGSFRLPKPPAARYQYAPFADCFAGKRRVSPAEGARFVRRKLEELGSDAGYILPLTMRLADRLAATGCKGLPRDARALLLVCASLALKINEGTVVDKAALSGVGGSALAGYDFATMERDFLELIDYDLLSCEDDDVKRRFEGMDLDQAQDLFIRSV